MRFLTSMLPMVSIFSAQFVVLLIGMFAWRWARNSNSLREPAVYLFVVLAGSFAAAAAAASLQLPHVPSMSSSQLIDDVADKLTLARILQEQGTALETTTQVVHALSFMAFLILMNAAFAAPGILRRMKAPPPTATVSS